MSCTAVYIIKAFPFKLNINLVGSYVNEQMSTHHMNTHHGGLEREGRFFPALQGPSLQQRVGAGRHGGAGMWIKQHGGKILGLLASVRFLLISHLVVLHVQLTTILRSPPSAEWLCAEVSAIWQHESFSFSNQGQHIWGNSTYWVFWCHLTGFTDVQIQFMTLAIFKVSHCSINGLIHPDYKTFPYATLTII